MQESRYDGGVVLTDCATQEQIERAMADPRNKTVALHRPGSSVILPSGQEYVCQANGSWVRLKSAAEKAAEAALTYARARLNAYLSEDAGPEARTP